MKNVNKQTVLTISLLAATACGKMPQNYPHSPYGYQQGAAQFPTAYGQQATYPSQSMQPTSPNAPGAAPPRQQLAQGRSPAPKINTKAPTAKTAPGKAAPPQAGRAPKSAPAPQAAKAPQGEEFLQKARQTFESLQGLSATVQTFEKSDKEGQGQVRLLFKKPGQVKIDVLNSTDSGQKGVKLSYSTGGGQVKVRPSGMLSLVSVSLAMTDPKLLSGRQYRLDQIDLASTAQRVTQPGQNPKVMGKTQMGSDTIVILETTPTNHFDPKVTRERIGIDMSTGMMRSIEMYEGDILVYAAKVLQVTLNPPLDPAAFNV